MTTAYLHPALIGGRVYLAPLAPPAVTVIPPDGSISFPTLTIPSSCTVNFGGGTNRVDFGGGINRVDFQ